MVDPVEGVAVTMAEVVGTKGVMTDSVTGARTDMAATVDGVWVLAAMPVVVVVVGVTSVGDPEDSHFTEGFATDELPSR